VSTARRGVVLRGAGGVWHVLDETGRLHRAALKGRVKLASGLKLAVGDGVTIRAAASGGIASIAEILPRRSSLVRRAPGRARGERVVVANLDQVVVVFAMIKPDAHRRMLDRFLVIAEANDLAARIVVNKIDLASVAEARARFSDYEAAGYTVHYTSCRTAEGLDALHQGLQARTSALTGPSGVGKSSLLNALYPGLTLRVGALSESVNKGRHTTVGASMHPLPDGGFVVDTPGLREIGLWGVPSDLLGDSFPELRARRGRCQFADCRHEAEPGCAVVAGVACAEVSGERYASYRKLLEEARESERVW
jgi:ribosome biogenesis GTPase